MIVPFPLLLLINNLNIPIFSLTIPYYLEPKRRNSIVKQERVRSTSQLSPTKFPARHPRGSVVHPHRQQQEEVVERRKRRRQLGLSKQPQSRRIANLLRRRSKNALQNSSNNPHYVSYCWVLYTNKRVERKILLIRERLRCVRLAEIGKTTVKNMHT